MALGKAFYGDQGGGGNIAISTTKAISANAHPSWNSTPFKAKKVFIRISFYYGGSSGSWYYTNFNPTTNEVDNTKAWTSYDGGNTWSQESVGWTITDTYIELLGSLSGATTVYCTFIITDNGDMEFEQ